MPRLRLRLAFGDAVRVASGAGPVQGDTGRVRFDYGCIVAARSWAGNGSWVAPLEALVAILVGLGLGLGSGLSLAIGWEREWLDEFTWPRQAQYMVHFSSSSFSSCHNIRIRIRLRLRLRVRNRLRFTLMNTVRVRPRVRV